MSQNIPIFRLLLRTFFVSIVFALLSAFLLPPPSLAKDYFIQSVVINAQLNTDGSMSINEKRTYNFKGHFHWASYFLPVEKTGKVVNFEIGEEGQPYKKDITEQIGTYKLNETPGSIEAKWFYEAEDEERTFIISYQILDVVKLYQDAGVLYYKFIGTGWDRPSQNVQVTIHPPALTNKEEVKAWAHGPLWGTIKISDEGIIRADVRSLPANRFWEVRSIYPVNLFPQIKSIIPEKVVPQILEEERNWADEANIQREEWLKKKEAQKAQKRYGALLLLGLSGTGFLICFTLYNRYGKKHKVPFPDTLYSEIPSDIPPALLNYILHYQQIDGKALVGTILDLARRGFLKLRVERPSEKKSFWSPKKPKYLLELNRDFYLKQREDLQDFEEDLLNFVFSELSGGKDIIDFKAIEKKRSRFVRWFQEWQKKIKSIGRAKGYWEEESLKARNKSLITGGILLGLTFISIFFVGKWALLSGISGFLILVLSFYIPRLRGEYELEAKKWKALRKYLNKYHFLQTGKQFFTENIEKFLVYGVILGLSQNVVKKIAEMIPVRGYNRTIPWYVYSGTGDFSPAGFAEGLSSLISSATSTMSSASGTGGGASGGGGGGGGGSGGGAG